MLVPGHVRAGSSAFGVARAPISSVSADAAIEHALRRTSQRANSHREGFARYLAAEFLTFFRLAPKRRKKGSMTPSIKQPRLSPRAATVVQGLRASTRAPNNLALALSALGRELGSGDTSQHSPQFLVEVEGAARELEVNLRDEVYRIAGEALRNALRHAQARRIEPESHYDEGQLRLRIRDDGKGMEAQVVDGAGRPGHWGLHGMRERAKVIGGNLELWSNFESGTEVELTIPASAAYGAAAFLVFRQACGDTRVIREPGGVRSSL